MFRFLKKIAFRRFKAYETSLHELNYLFWECTTRCNLNCIHCGSDCARDSIHADMPSADFFRALETIPSPVKGFTVVITGGEPLMRNDLEECGREIRRRGMRWAIVSNGQIYTKERHISLLNAGMGALTISLDGLEDTHNWLRNTSGSFSNVDHAIGLAAKAARLNFDVVTCVNQRNIHQLAQIHDYLVKKGVKAWRLFTIIPIGRAKYNSELLLSDVQFREMMEFITLSRKKSAMDVKFSCEGYVGAYETKVRDTYFFCRAGINIGSVLIDGSISACPNTDRALAQGNIYKDNFYEVWQNRFTPFRNRSWTHIGKCAKCNQYKDCQGNGLHNWHGNKDQVLVCHYAKVGGAK
jgi:radical SAM enzyme (rSAM/lipoprotein system)